MRQRSNMDSSSYVFYMLLKKKEFERSFYSESNWLNFCNCLWRQSESVMLVKPNTFLNSFCRFVTRAQQLIVPLLIKFPKLLKFF